MPDLLTTLALLGDAPDDIASALRERGIKGRPYQARYCPLARFLSEELGKSCLVSRWGIVVSGRYDRPLPASAAEFICRFDNEEWPELVEDVDA